MTTNWMPPPASPPSTGGGPVLTIRRCTADEECNDTDGLVVLIPLVCFILLLVAALLYFWHVSRQRLTQLMDIVVAAEESRSTQLARSTTNAPPRLDPPWMPADGKTYACFLSHAKEEAGADARYLRDLLERMLCCRVFLD